MEIYTVSNTEVILYTLLSTLSPKIHEKVRKWIETSETDIHNVLDNKYEAVVPVFIMLSNVLALYADHVFGFQKHESNIMLSYIQYPVLNCIL